jgi:peptidoglycan/xylan/chitin deacetylase (PgdA/CDA1 family)
MSLRARISRLVKLTIAHGLHVTGLLDALIAWRLRRAGIVLMYHRVLPAGADSFSSPGIVVTPKTFALHMRVLREKLRALTAAEFGGALASGTLPAKACLVTFDDGWFDNHEYALPILERERVPALMFVATDYIDSSTCFWQERVSRGLDAAWRAGERGSPALAANGVPPLAKLTEPDARRAIQTTIGDRKRLPLAQLEAWIESLFGALAAAGVTVESGGDDRFMSWTQVAALANSEVVTLGSHACSHRPLSKIDAATRRRELDESRRILKARLGREVRTIAYPDGGHDDATVDDTRAAGYELAFTTVRGTVSAGDAPLRLRRVNIAEYGTGTRAEFLCRIAGVL